MKKTILIDMDGVVVDLMGELATRTTLYHPICKWNFFGCCMPLSAAHILNTDTTVFKNAPAIPGAIEGVKQLSDRYNVRFVSTPWEANPDSASAKIRWLTNHGFDHHQIILAWDKTKIQGDLLIDDKPGLTGPWPIMQYPQSWNVDSGPVNNGIGLRVISWEEGLADVVVRAEQEGLL